MSPQNPVYHLYESVPQFHLPQERPRGPETGIKDSFEEMEREVFFGMFRPEKQDYLFRYSFAPEMFR